jgi:hypothetical protein
MSSKQHVPTVAIKNGNEATGSREEESLVLLTCTIGNLLEWIQELKQENGRLQERLDELEGGKN